MRQLEERFKILLERLGLLRKRSYSLNGIDLELDRLMNRRNGIFVEAGGNDGLTQSNTLYFERYRGWHGLLVEPIPALAERCRANRPGARVEQYALVGPELAGSTVSMTYCNLMSLVNGAMGSSAADRNHLDLGKPFLGHDEETYTVDVPARRLSDVLDDAGIRHVDLLSLDVEGFEPQVLDGLDFARHRPVWMVVESRDAAAMDARLAEHYRFVRQIGPHDRVYRRLVD